MCFDYMNYSQLFILFLLFIFPSEAQDTSTTLNGSQPIRPAVATITPVLVVLFLLLVTLSVYIYSKYFYRHIPDLSNHHSNFNQLLRSTSRSSGIDRSVIESIPFFKFSSLKGSKEGLECSVCLSTYEDSELLRLLPKCKHAFHMTCIDEWLESHSSCPICRYKFDSTEFTSFLCTSSLRYNGNRSAPNLMDSPNLELFVQREEDRHESIRFNSGNSVQKLTESRNEDCLALENDLEKKFHKLKHKIIVSDIFHKRRWSDLNSSDLMFLNSEMLNIMSSKRFNSNSPKDNLSMNEQPSNAKDDMERKLICHTISVSGSSDFSSPLMIEGSKNINSGLLRSTEKRSRSEIISLARFKDFRARSNKNTEMSSLENNSREERIWRLWLPIARRTFQWFTVREKRFEGSRMRTHTSNV